MQAVPIASAERSAGCEPLRRVRTERFCLVERLHAARSFLGSHFHETANVSFVLRGSCNERAGTGFHDCEPYDVLVTPPGHVHTLTYGERGARSLSVEFALSGIASAAPALERPMYLSRSLAAPLASRIQREWRCLDDLSDLAIEGVLLELLVEAHRTLPTRELHVPRWLREVSEFLRTSFHRSLTIEEIARAADVHPVYLARTFRRFYRCAPAEYIRALRIDFARRHLTTSAAPLVEIAARAGFSSQSHFSTAFRRATGFTPLDYRRSFAPRSPDEKKRDR